MNLSLEHVVPALRARWRAVALTWFIVVAAVVALSFAMPRYEASASLVVDRSALDPIAGQASSRSPDAVSTHIATQMDIVRSQEVALGAVRVLGLQKQPKWRESWEKATDGIGDFEPWIAEGLLRRLVVRPSSRDSNVLTVAYVSSDPEIAASVANAFVKSYMDASLQMQVGPARRFNAFFEERAKPLRAALEQARARLSAYEKEHGVLVGEESDVESSRLAELTSQLVTLQDAAADASSRRRQAGSAPGEVREVRDDPEVAALTGELVRQEGQLADLKSEFGEKHPAVIQARQSIRDARQRLDGAMRRMAQGLGSPEKVIGSRLADVRASIERQRAVVLQRKAQRDAASALQRDVENAQKAYDAVLARASQTALESANTTQTNLSVLKWATAPLWPPSTLMRNTMVAMLLGLLLGIARALFAESRDPRLRTIRDITHRLRQPLLLAMPDGDARGAEDARRSAQTRERLVTGQRRLPGPRWELQ